MSDIFGSGIKRPVIITLLERSGVSVSMFGPSEYNYEYDRLCVWYEKGYLSAFKKIKGVFHVVEDNPEPRYYLYIDPRFDTKWVMAEVEAVIQIGKPQRTKK